MVSCGIVALYGPFYLLIFLRTTGLRFSLYQKLSKLRKQNFAPLFCHEIGCENDQTYIFRFVRYLSTFFYTYLPINIHFQFIIITNISFVTNPAYFVRHLTSLIVSFWGHVIFPNITLFIYKPQIRVWFVYALPKMFSAVLYKEKWEFGSSWHIFFNK